MRKPSIVHEVVVVDDETDRAENIKEGKGKRAARVGCSSSG
jgi:hypothetical protein